jgi:hypothetical protein
MFQTNGATIEIFHFSSLFSQMILRGSPNFRLDAYVIYMYFQVRKYSCIQILMSSVGYVPKICTLARLVLSGMRIVLHDHNHHFLIASKWREKSFAELTRPRDMTS